METNPLFAPLDLVQFTQSFPSPCTPAHHQFFDSFSQQLVQIHNGTFTLYDQHDPVTGFGKEPSTVYLATQ